tara:strand:+ start:3047 stop:3445 length:399 start_codon:yes stop_codon:yes gene_type:complete
MSDFATELFELGARIVRVTAPLPVHLETRKDKERYIQKLGGDTLRTKDAKPLHAGTKKVLQIMSNGIWFTIPELREASGLDQADRRMRELRGHGYMIERKRIGDSRSFQYRLKYDTTELEDFEYRLKFDCKM